MKPKFSVIIAVYNKERFLAETLQSVLDQGYTDFEIVLVNDGSTDGSQAIIESFLTDSRIAYYSQDNKGAGAARNTAIAYATHPYIALLDADDLWDTNYLEEIAKLIRQYPEESVFASGQRMLEHGRLRDKHYAVSVPKGQNNKLNFFKASNSYAIIHSSAVVIHKRAFEKVGLYNPQITSGQDTDLWIRLGLEYPVVFLNKVLSTYRMMPGSLYRSTSSMKQKFDPDGYKSQEAERPDLKKYLDLNRYALARQAKIWGEYAYFKRLRDGIDSQHLNQKQKFLLALPRPLLKLSLWLKTQLQKLGINLSAHV